MGFHQARHLGVRVIGTAGSSNFVGATNPESGPFRAGARSRILTLAQARELVAPMARTFEFEDAPRLSRCSPARIRAARSL
jgi:hypothetical protein